MRCCEAWELVGQCFEPISFECIDFQKLCQIIANLTRENLAEREEEIANLPWTQTEKDKALTRCRSGQRAWRAKKPVLCLNAVTDEDCHQTKMSQEEDFVNIGELFSKPAQKVRDTTNTKSSYDMFKKLPSISAGPLIVPSSTSSLR